MVNYLEFFPRPLLVDLCENQVLPFIGSGFSLNANIPQDRQLPLIGRIANCLKELMPEFDPNNPCSTPMDVISEFDIRFGRAQWAEELYKMLLVGVAHPGAAHRAFARLPFDIVATTNVEQLLEEAYFEVGRFPQVVMFEDQLPVKDTSDNPVTLLKVHGDVNFPDRLIWTEQDYDTFVARFPLYVTYLASLLITRTPLFVGYSIDDYDFRMIWNIIGLRLGKLRRQAYAIEVGASPTLIARYQRRGVEVINLPGRREDFGQILTDTFSQLRRFLANCCPPAGIPPCSALGVPIDVNCPNGGDNGDDETNGDDITNGDDTDDSTFDDDDRDDHNDRKGRNDGRDCIPPPDLSVGVSAPMALIRRGSCVGVYYWRGNQIRVHNGRLLRARYGNTWFNYVDTARMPDVVEIAHYNVDRSLGIMYLENLPIRRIVQVNRTPDLDPTDPNYCRRFRGLPPRPDRIRPGNCIGMRFIRANGQMDVKNGKFLYWLDNNNRRHCVLREGQSVPTIVYMHMNVERDREGNILGLVPEIRSRDGILEVRRTTLLPTPS